MPHIAGFEIDQQRAELRRPDGTAIRLRPKSFAMLQYFAANTGRILTKQELLEAIWPNISVGEEALATNPDNVDLQAAVPSGMWLEFGVARSPVT